MPVRCGCQCRGAAAYRGPWCGSGAVARIHIGGLGVAELLWRGGTQGALVWQSCCGAAAHRGPWWRCGCQCGAGASAVARRHIAHGLSLPGPMVCALVPLCAWRRCLLCSWGVWLVSPHWFLCALVLSLHTGSSASVRLASLPLVQLGAWLVSPHWLLCAHGLSLHTGSSVRVACLSTLAPLCGWRLCILCSWGTLGLSLPRPMVRALVPRCARRLCLLCSWGALGLSLPRPMMRAASLPLVQLGRAWLVSPSSYGACTGSCLLCIRGPSSIGRAPHKVCISVCGQVLNQYPHVPAYHRPSFDMRMTRLVWGVVQNQSLGGDGEATLEGRSHVSVEYLCILPANPAGVTKQYARTTRAICPHHESGVT